jgi:hypothetical protein
MSGAIAVWFAAALSGCGDDALGDDEFSGGCNIALRACQEAVFDSAANLRGQPGATRPRVRTITIQQATREFRSELGAEDDDVWGPALGVLRLQDEQQSSGEVAIGRFLEQVAAYYDPRTGGVTVLDHGAAVDPVNDVFVLAHEFVHALQDADVGLEAFRDTWVTSTDSLVATKCLTEGEAMVLGLGVMAEALGLSAHDLDWDRAAAAALEGVLADTEEQPSKFVSAVQGLPYPLGLSALASRWLSGGQGAIDALYDRPVLSVADWATARLGGNGFGEPLDCYPTQGPPGYSAIDHDVFGATGVLAFAVAMGATGGESWERARDSRNDSIVLYRSDADPRAVAVAWRIRSPHAAWLASLVDRSPSADLRVEVVGTEVLIVGGTEPGVANLVCHDKFRIVFIALISR